MAFSIALAGKGGTGKTTLAGMVVRYLTVKEKGPVLAVDADSNANLNDVLGVPLDQTIGSARESMRKGIIPGNITKDVFLSMKMEEAIVEADGFDLIAMGQPEGRGCYCAANSLLTGFLEKLIDNYPYIVIDNEAGMEHISRLTTRNVDVLLIVSDTSRRGVQAAIRIGHLARELNIQAGKSYLIVNQAKDDPVDDIKAYIENTTITFAGVVPEDPMVYEYDFNGKPTIHMPKDNKAVKAAFDIFDQILF